MAEVTTGLYRHFKGNTYRVFGVGKHTESHDNFVLYQGLYHSPEFGVHPLWARPADLFFDEMDRPGYKGPRFVKLADAGPYTCKDCGAAL